MKILFSVEDLFVVEPLGLMQLIAIAKKLGHQCYFAAYKDKKFFSLFKKIKPDMVAISIMSISDRSSKEIIKKIKRYNPDTFVLVGGPHPTYYPDFIKNSLADAICVGEGDEAFADILQALTRNKSIQKIANIYTRNSQNPPRPLVENLDKLPFPDRDLIYQNSELGRMKLKSFMATRGLSLIHI